MKSGECADWKLALRVLSSTCVSEGDAETCNLILSRWRHLADKQLEQYGAAVLWDLLRAVGGDYEDVAKLVEGELWIRPIGQYGRNGRRTQAMTCSSEVVSHGSAYSRNG